MTDTILKLLDPSALPPKAQANLAEIGPFLASGSFTLEEIGRQLDPPRSDWVASRVAEARTAIAEQVLENAGDELDDEL